MIQAGVSAGQSESAICFNQCMVSLQTRKPSPHTVCLLCRYRQYNWFAWHTLPRMGHMVHWKLPLLASTNRHCGNKIQASLLRKILGQRRSTTGLFIIREYENAGDWVGQVTSYHRCQVPVVSCGPLLINSIKMLPRSAIGRKLASSAL